MNQFKKSKSNIKLPIQRTEAQEFGKAKSGIVFCSKCHSVYYKKCWHHSLGIKTKKDLPINFALCPVCAMIKNRQFEGQITIKNVPEKISYDLIHMIKNSGLQAFDRDPMDRVIEIKETKEGIVVTTTENELAQKIAKKIAATFRTHKPKISYTASPSDVLVAVVEF